VYKICTAGATAAPSFLDLLKFRMAFWCWFIEVVLDKRLFNESVCVLICEFLLCLTLSVVDRNNIPPVKVPRQNVSKDRIAITAQVQKRVWQPDNSGSRRKPLLKWKQLDSL